jgi:hypothetical protein
MYNSPIGVIHHIYRFCFVAGARKPAGYGWDPVKEAVSGISSRRRWVVLRTLKWPQACRAEQAAK